MLDPQIAQARQRRADLGLGKGNRRIQQIAIDDLVEQTLAGNSRQQLAGHGIARYDHVHRRLQTNGARQSLGAAGTGNQTDLDLRQRNLRAARRDAVMAAQRQLQTTAHAHAMDRDHHRLGALFDRQNQGQQIGFRQGRRRAEFLDVGTAAEGLAGAVDDDRVDRRIGQRAIQARGQRSPGVETQPVHRRIVQRQHRDLVAGSVLSGHDKLRSDWSVVVALFGIAELHSALWRSSMQPCLDLLDPCGSDVT